MLLDELLDEAPGELPVQVEVKAYGDPELARVTGSAVCRVACTRPDRGRVEVLSFHMIACEETARHVMPPLLVAWADYMPAALARWAARAVSVEHFLLHPPSQSSACGSAASARYDRDGQRRHAPRASGCSRRRRDQHRSIGGLRHELVKMPRSA
jgi:hypothetical protein